ncbi:MAG: hypothetical protein O3A93_06940 [Chloroflexi bacterium]|nr:hypothetical protein [Chloroflexota bacterium]MDA1270979.1 hypothetical protein [Chloroflexota bacterium]PKB58270.1 MAG: hypothetical protein BZY83_08110 [SAR202 cluster bacterium Casp-Chloro-G2]
MGVVGETGIWVTVILAGILALGVREYVRANGTFSARLEQVKLTFAAGILVLLGVTSAVLAVMFIYAVVIVEIWRPLLVVLAVISGLAACLIWWLRRSNEP